MLARKTKVRLIDTTGFACNPHVGRAHDRPVAWFRSAEHLAWLRTQPCACGSFHPVTEGIEAAHVRTKTDGAASVKPSDFYALPLNPYCHRIQHSMSEAAYWSQRGVVDPAGLALSYAERSTCERTRKAAAAVMGGKPWQEAF